MIELMAETVDILRDVCMDPRVPNGIKESLWSHAGKLNAAGKSDLHDYVTQRVAAEREAKDNAYLERNRCVALIARMAVAMGLRVAVTQTAIEGWSEDWHGCIYIGLPTGQVSWHFHVSQAHLFDGLPQRAEAWDGHDTPEKYRRVDAAYRVDAEAGSNDWLTPLPEPHGPPVFGYTSADMRAYARREVAAERERVQIPTETMEVTGAEPASSAERPR